MIRNQAKQKLSKRLLLVSFFAIVLVGTTLLIFNKLHINLASNKASTQGPTKQQKAAQQKTDAVQKSTYLDQAYSQSGTSDGATNSSGGTSSSQTLTPSLNISASQTGSTVTILTKLLDVASGSCTLNITNGSYSTAQTAQIIYQPNFSTCAGFSVSTSSIGSGDWKITITANTNVGSVEQSTTLEVE